MIRGYLLRTVACIGMALAAACALACPGVASAQTVSATTADGDVRIQIGPAANLPADFPADVWLPEEQALQRVEQSGVTTTLVFAAAGANAALAGEYDARMQAAGWTRARVVDPDSGCARAWEKDGRAVVAEFTANDGGGTRVRLQVLPRR